VSEERCLVLTEGQPRRPLLGGGLPRPRAFTAPLDWGGALLLASDGLFNYGSADTICRLIRTCANAEACCSALVDSVRLPNGALQDDVGVVLVGRWRRALERALIEQARKLIENPPSPIRTYAIEDWIISAVPQARRFSTDGMLLNEIRESDEGTIRFCGWIWETVSQRLVPFEVELIVGGSRLESWQLWLGDSLYPTGVAGDPKHFGLATPRDWLVATRGPSSK
jgi:hypothetical protein